MIELCTGRRRVLVTLNYAEFIRLIGGTPFPERLTLTSVMTRIAGIAGIAGITGIAGIAGMTGMTRVGECESSQLLVVNGFCFPEGFGRGWPLGEATVAIDRLAEVDGHERNLI